MIININKPLNWTSFDVVKKVRSLLNIKKVGHAGTLDPLATGVLIILTEKDTKKQNEIMNSKKEYIAEVAFGGTTPTYDLEFPVEFRDRTPSVSDITPKLPDLLKKFTGLIQQKAPAYSAKKVKGERLYKKARKGIINEDEIPVKEIEIFEIEIISIDKKRFKNSTDNEKVLPVATLRVVCSSGTYIRSLAYDLGNAMGYGGVLSKLQRTRVGEYSVEDSIELKDLKS